MHGLINVGFAVGGIQSSPLPPSWWIGGWCVDFIGNVFAETPPVAVREPALLVPP